MALGRQRMAIRADQKLPTVVPMMPIFRKLARLMNS